MAIVSESASDPNPVDKGIATRQAHGLATPRDTPEPDNARLDADKERRQTEAQTHNAEGHSSGAAS